MKSPTIAESRRLLIFLIAIGVMGLLMSLIWTIYSIHATADRNTELLRIVRECTTPGQECAERSRKQTAAAVADINEVAVIAAACVDRRGVQSVAEIERCVMEAITHEVQQQRAD